MKLMSDDRRLREQLAQLNANILQLSADLQRDRTQQTSIVASELRALSSSIAKLISEKYAPRPVSNAPKES